jgi:hypothetical protein
MVASGRVETARFRDASRGGGGDEDDETARFVLTDAVTVRNDELDRTRAVDVHVRAGLATEAAFEKLRRLLDESRGSCAVFLHVRASNRGQAILALLG